jgi:diguanylate cyclase (GGDEF)-like protein
MFDPAQSVPDTGSGDGAPRLSARHFVGATLFALTVFLLTEMIARRVMTAGGALSTVRQSVLLLAGIAVALAMLGCLFHQLYYWQWPLYRLRRTLKSIRAGQAPLEDLTHQSGGAMLLVPVLREVLVDWRQQKTRLAEMEAEIRQRVATRTDAMERVIGSLRQQATHDPLTGLFNRRMLDQYLPIVVDRLRGGDLCLLMVDIDYFKSLNDTLGHGAGDTMLRSVGQLIRSTIREHDLAFRYGGDEFVILLPQSRRDAGEALSQRLCSLVSEVGRTYGLPRPPGLSIGVTLLADRPDATPAQLIADADAALYVVKGQHHQATLAVAG